MGLLSIASRRSIERGYEYYAEKKVLSFIRRNADEFTGTVAGSSGEVYDVAVSTAHPRSSTCTCPYAAGRQIVCKHKVALYFTAFPQEADDYFAEMEARRREQEEYEEEQERLWQECHDEMEQFVMSLTVEQMREMLLNYLVCEAMENSEEDRDEYDPDSWDYL